MTSFSVGRIDFINTSPVYYGIDTGQVTCPGDTKSDFPSILNLMLRDGEIQISSISSVAYAQNYPNWLILPSLSISARGPVESVLLCFREPLSKKREPRVGLTHKSATAKALTRIVLEDMYRLKPSYQVVNLSEKIGEDLDGILVIGDDAFRIDFKEPFPHVLDLGAFWVKETKLPFVFGLWAVDKTFAEKHPDETASVAKALQDSAALGKKDLSGAARLASQRTGVSEESCKAYLEHIEYDLDEDHLKGLELFYSHLKRRGELDKEVKPLLWSAEGGETRSG